MMEAINKVGAIRIVNARCSPHGTPSPGIIFDKRPSGVRLCHYGRGPLWCLLIGLAWRLLKCD